MKLFPRETSAGLVWDNAFTYSPTFQHLIKFPCVSTSRRPQSRRRLRVHPRCDWEVSATASLSSRYSFPGEASSSSTKFSARFRRSRLRFYWAVVFNFVSSNLTWWLERRAAIMRRRMQARNQCMIRTMLTACLSPIVSPAVDQGGSPTGPH